MSDASPGPAGMAARGEPLLPWVLATIVIAVSAAIAAVTLDLDAPLEILFLLPVAVAGAAMLFWSTRATLFFVAFAIFPLGIVQREVFSVTINLAEALILFLFVKETIRFFLTGERPAAAVPWIALIIYGAASFITIGTGVVRGNQPAGVLQDFRQFTEYITLFLLVTHRITNRRDIILMLGCFVLGGVIVASHGIAQRYTGIGIPGTQVMSDLVYHGALRSGSFYGSTPLGAIMVLCLGPTIGLMLTLKSRLMQGILASFSVILVVAAVFTNTRASWIAIAILLLYVFLAVRKTRAMVTVSVIGALVFSAWLGPIVWQRMGTIEVSRTERSLLERVQYYTTAWHIFQEAPVFGLGWGSYYRMWDILLNERYVHREPVTRPDNIYVEPVTVHSAYLQLIVKGGLVLLCSFGLFILRWLWLLAREYRTRPKEERDHNLFIGVSAALVGYLFHSGVENFFQWPVMSQSFWLLMGLSFLMGHRIITHGRIDPPAEPPARG